MSRPHLKYFEPEDILQFVITDERESASIEVSPGITAELNANGDVIGIEILDATAFFSDFVAGLVPGGLFPIKNIKDSPE